MKASNNIFIIVCPFLCLLKSRNAQPQTAQTIRTQHFIIAAIKPYSDIWNSIFALWIGVPLNNRELLAILSIRGYKKTQHRSSSTWMAFFTLFFCFFALRGHKECVRSSANRFIIDQTAPKTAKQFVLLQNHHCVVSRIARTVHALRFRWEAI